jgi:simple sugar transport system substrate-binding protein
MQRKFNYLVFINLLCSFLLFSIPGVSIAEHEDFLFGLIMFGAKNDRGWNQAHYEAGLYVQRLLPGTSMIPIEKMNPMDRPGLTIQQLVNDLISKGAELIISTSDYMAAGIRKSAKIHPRIYFVQIPGDDALSEESPENLSNLMGRMEYGKMMAGFTAGMTTKTGKIGYIGPLVNVQTRRHAIASFLGAKYAWENILLKDSNNMSFKVVWTGYWFDIPGVTTDPTEIALDFFNSGYDVIISGIDSIEPLNTAYRERKLYRNVWAIPYNSNDTCLDLEDACLGVPYFNWGPDYVEFIEAAITNQWEKQWIWSGPFWEDINNEYKSAVGFIPGATLPLTTLSHLDNFIEALGSGYLKLFRGPLNYQDGSPFLKPGEIATDKQIWYIDKLLEGMEGGNSAR